MELRHLRYFVAVAEELHFGRAAGRLNISQPPLSMQIRALEQEVGGQLFERSKRRVELTEAGRFFLEEARAILTRTDEAKRRAAQIARGAAGHLEVGFTGSAPFNDMVPLLLARLRREWPEVQLLVHQMTTAEQLEAIYDGRLDIGFARPAPSELPRRGIVATLALRERLLVALSSDHPLAGSDRIALAALKDDAFVLPPRHVTAGFYDKVMELCAQAGFVPRVAMEAYEISTFLTLAAAGIGVSVVVAGMRRVGIAGVSLAEVEDDDAFIDLLVIYRENDTSPTVRNFRELLSLLQNRPSAIDANRGV